jgi:hypothetical protein
MSAWKLVTGTACGIVAFLTRNWAYDNGDFFFWTLVALAGNFYATVLTDLLTSAATGAIAGAPAAPTSPQPPPDPAYGRLAAATVSLILCLVVAYTAQRAIIGVYSHDYRQHGDQTLTALAAWFMGMVVLFGVPLVSGRLARAALLALITVRGGLGLSSQSAQVLGFLGAVVAAGLTLWLGWHSIALGIDDACARGEYPFGCPG